MGVLIIFLVSCTPKNVDPVVPIGSIIDRPATAPEPETVAQNQRFVRIKHPYYPIDFEAKVGEEVLWINDYLKSSFYVIGDEKDPFKSHLVKPGMYFAHVYEKPGTYQYILSPGKSGTVTVE